MSSLEHTSWGSLPHRAWRLPSVDVPRGLSTATFFFGVLLIVVLSSAGFLYIRQVISTASSGYDVTALERRADALRVRQAALELETAELQALGRVEERLPALDLVPVVEPTYARPLTDTVVTSQIPVGRRP